MSARGRHRRQRARARHISRISLMLSAGGAGIVLPLVASGGAHAASAETYEVAVGDTLYEIAAEHDIDGGWQALYEANRDVIGDDPRLITPGLELVLGEGAATTQSAPAEQTAVATSVGDYTAPVSGPLGTAYGVAGSMWSSGHHTGVDFPVASGTPVVVSASSALREIVRPGCGAAVPDHAPAFAGAVTTLLDHPEPTRRSAARARAEEYPWQTAVTGMLTALRAT